MKEKKDRMNGTTLDVIMLIAVPNKEGKDAFRSIIMYNKVLFIMIHKLSNLLRGEKRERKTRELRPLTSL